MSYQSTSLTSSSLSILVADAITLLFCLVVAVLAIRLSEAKESRMEEATGTLIAATGYRIDQLREELAQAVSPKLPNQSKWSGVLDSSDQVSWQIRLCQPKLKQLDSGAVEALREIREILTNLKILRERISVKIGRAGCGSSTKKASIMIVPTRE